MKGSQSKTGQGSARRSRGDKRPKGKRRKENAILRYFRQTLVELKKVSWPDRREATNLTLIVLTVTVAMSAFLGLTDWLFSLFFSWLVQLSS